MYLHKNFGSWVIPSQDPNIAGPTVKAFAEAHYLPVLVKVWKDVERITGYRWKATSYWRRSPSHQHGVSLDIAPDIAPSSEKYYAVSRMSDPVLYKRTKLIRSLQALARSESYAPFSVGLFVEPDHIHIQLIDPQGAPRVKVLKWKLVKPSYRDSATRSQLPMVTKPLAFRNK
jgi:hypothetical protein